MNVIETLVKETIKLLSAGPKGCGITAHLSDGNQYMLVLENKGGLEYRGALNRMGLPGMWSIPAFPVEGWAVGGNDLEALAADLRQCLRKRTGDSLRLEDLFCRDRDFAKAELSPDRKSLKAKTSLWHWRRRMEDRELIDFAHKTVLSALFWFPVEPGQSISLWFYPQQEHASAIYLKIWRDGAGYAVSIEDRCAPMIKVWGTDLWGRRRRKLDWPKQKKHRRTAEQVASYVGQYLSRQHRFAFDGLTASYFYTCIDNGRW